MKKFSIVFLILIFLVFLFYQTQKSSDFQVLRVSSPTKIIIDLNKNGVEDDNELIELQNIESFSTKPSKSQSELAKKLKITQEDALGLGFLAENLAKENLADKQVRLEKENSQIIVNNKNYETMLLNSGLAIKKDSKITPQLQKNILKVRKLNLRIFNNKSHKYHKLNCKYGLIAHNSQILPASQMPKDAKPCKFCLGIKQKAKSKKQKVKYQYYNDKIPDIKSPATIFQTNCLKIFLTDFTRVLKPSNSCNTPICNILVQEINSTQNSIDFAIYGYSKIPRLQKALENAQARGVKIRFVYDLDNKNNNIYPDTTYLAKILTNSRADNAKNLMHDKFFIFDHKTVVTGSANISNTDMSGFNSNALILINSEKIANIYSQEFEQMFCGNFHKSKIKYQNNDGNTELQSTHDPNVMLFQGHMSERSCDPEINSGRRDSHRLIVSRCNTDLAVYFSPEDRPITTQIIPLINNAQKYVYMPVFLITHKALADSLIRASNRGVAVKVILDATNTHTGSSKMKMLRQAGIQVKTENFAGKLHSKSIIIDDLYTVIGSMNFSRSGEGVNDENLIIIKNKEIAIFYKTFFQYLWKRIPDKWLKYNARAESPDSIGSCSDGIDNDFDGKIDMADDSCKIKN